GNVEVTDFLTVSAGFFGGNSFDPTESDDGGLFNEEFSILGQATFSFLDDRLQVAGTYVLGQFGADDNTIFDLGVGTSTARQPFGDGEKVAANSYGVASAFQLNDRIAINAFGMFTDALISEDGDGDAEIWSYGAGVSFPDLGREGNLGAVFAGVEPYADDESNPIHLEALYKYQFNDNISVTPGVVYLINPNGNDEDDDALLGVLRTTFTF
ncbi:MAG: iron uptake porin, partial [Cyanobacteria bacterium J06623_1]